MCFIQSGDSLMPDMSFREMRHAGCGDPPLLRADRIFHQRRKGNKQWFFP